MKPRIHLLCRLVIVITARLYNMSCACPHINMDPFPNGMTTLQLQTPENEYGIY